ncbi:MAG: AAA family ATPase [Selenomonadaceae bacterium]|nr:AAA family ATPase [Selenomonadaceae bacterium]
MPTNEHFITKIHIDKVRNLENITIDLSKEKRQHLLLTGKNGSGKTSLLNDLIKTLSAINENKWVGYKQYKNNIYPNSPLKSINDNLYKKFTSGVEINFNEETTIDNAFSKGNFITAFFPATRQTNIALPHGVEDIKLSETYNFSSDPAQLLIKYMVHLKTQQAYARQENDLAVEQHIKNWFNRFQTALKDLLDDESLVLKYDYKRYNFQIIQKNKLPFDFNGLSDGYSSVIKIVSDLILRMEQNWLLKGNISSYDVEGVALIDELETHLHIEMQRKILPFLTSFFPNIQFIVSTHSPYVLTSISNAVIYDLEKQVKFTDMSNYSIDDVAEAFFNSEDYSLKFDRIISRYRELTEKENLIDDEKIEKIQLATELKNVSGKLAPRIRNEFLEITGEANGKN